MSFEVPGFVNGVQQATADLSADQYLCVKCDNTGKIALCDTLAEKVMGILQNKPLAGQGADVMVTGISKAVASGSITAGDKLEVTAAGKVQTAVSDQIAVNATIDFASMTTGTSNSQNATVTGAVVGDEVSVAPKGTWPALGLFGYVSAADTVTLVASNTTAGTLDPASQAFAITVNKSKRNLVGQALESVADGNIVAVLLNR